MYFENVPEMALPEDANYYFNVRVVTIGVARDVYSDLFPEGVEEIWYTDEVTSARPVAYNFYLADDEDLEDSDQLDMDMIVEIFTNQVLEISEKYGVCFYDSSDGD